MDYRFIKERERGCYTHALNFPWRGAKRRQMALGNNGKREPHIIQLG